MADSSIGGFEIGVSSIGAVAPTPATPYMNLLPGTAAFPPSQPQSLANVIPSYLYNQYNDDDDLAAFVSAYNQLAQIYVDWFNKINLPIYTGLSGPLLDWIGQGFYGIARPTLYSNQPDSIGLLNSFELNQIEINEFDIINNITNLTVTNDDVYQRAMTWAFYKGDGKQFSAQWLRRRVARFLYGANGGDFNSPTQNISVIFGGGNLTITILSGISRTVSDTEFNDFEFNSAPINDIQTTVTPIQVPAIAMMFCEAVNTGAIELPAKFNATARIGVIGVSA